MASIQGIFPLASKPGVKRDGTEFDGNYYTNSQWCRWQRGRPRKIGGYNLFSGIFNGPVRGTLIDKINTQTQIYAGSDRLQLLSIDNTQMFYDRTPLAMPAFQNINWQFCTLYDAGGFSKKIIAYPGQDLFNIESGATPEIYFGDILGSAPLIGTGKIVAGGIFSLEPYLFALDNYGGVAWSVPNTPNDFVGAGSGDARIAGNKLIKGVKTRGGSGASPAGLIWAVDELYRVTFVGGAPIFSFDYVGDTSLLSTNGVVEYNGRHYWPDINGFKTYNGLIEDLPNDMNLNYFYDNLNLTQRQKVWGIKVPRYNEIWWFWPKGNATECTDVLIYNVKDRIWYDTAWPEDQGARTCGVYNKSLGYPYMFGVDQNGAGKYNLYQHEFGVDRTEGATRYAIRSSFETANITYCANLIGDEWMGQDRWVELIRIEPDFVLNGNMTVRVLGRNYAQSDTTEAYSNIFDSTTSKLDPKVQRRELRVAFESNEIGGDYQSGLSLLHMKIGDGRQ